MKRVLVLGAGLVAGPLVRYLLDVASFRVTVASRTVDKAVRLIGGAPNGTPLRLDASDEAELARLIAAHDLAISLLPYTHHPRVAKQCVEHRVPMVTTSYVKDEMRALDGAARAAGVLLLNEIGVDPGIDHMSALQVIHRIQREGGKIVSFASNTGGLPAPDANDNPFGYKFSWAPRGVIVAGKSPARYLKDGEIVDVPGPELFAHRWTCPVVGFGDFEVYPNRDSLPYIEAYGIPTVRGMFRGTLRYPGWCETLKGIVDLGLLDEATRDDLAGLTFVQWMAGVVGSESRDAKRAVADRLGISIDSKPIRDLEWLGLFSEDPIPAQDTAYLDVLASRMLAKMQYAPGERDMLVMQHEFVSEYPDRTERVLATMIDYGIPHGDSSMSRLVGLPAAIAARRILEGEIGLSGVHTPVLPEIYEPVLAELAEMGVSFREMVERL